MDEFTLYVSPMGVLSLRTNRGRKYEIQFKDCTNANVVYCWLHGALHDHRPNGEAKYFYSRDDEAATWRWIKKLNENAWIDPVSLGAVIKGFTNSVTVRPTNRQVVEHEWVSLKLA